MGREQPISNEYVTKVGNVTGRVSVNGREVKVY
jgi:hypothetical protein